MVADETRNNTFVIAQRWQMKRRGSPLPFEYANAAAAPAASQQSRGRVCGRGDGGGGGGGWRGGVLQHLPRNSPGLRLGWRPRRGQLVCKSANMVDIIAIEWSAASRVWGRRLFSHRCQCCDTQSEAISVGEAIGLMKSDGF